jgi:hypothetical protein
VSRVGRGLVTGIAAVVTFGVCFWLAMVVKLHFLPNPGSDRVVVAATFAGVMATLAGGCGWWGNQEKRPESAEGGTGSAGQQITASPGSFQLGQGAQMTARDITIVNPPAVQAPGKNEARPKA